VRKKVVEVKKMEENGGNGRDEHDGRRMEEGGMGQLMIKSEGGRNRWVNEGRK
jgi:hypothetical protein